MVNLNRPECAEYGLRIHTYEDEMVFFFSHRQRPIAQPIYTPCRWCACIKFYTKRRYTALHISRFTIGRWCEWDACENRFWRRSTTHSTVNKLNHGGGTERKQSTTTYKMFEYETNGADRKRNRERSEREMENKKRIPICRTEKKKMVDGYVVRLDWYHQEIVILWIAYYCGN